MSPPSPAATFFVAYSEKQVTSAIEPILRPRYSLSAAWAASSTSGMPCVRSGSRSAGWPARSTGTIAFVLSVISSGTRSGSIFRSESRTSAKTGVAPAWTITLAVAGQVIGVVITSSPGPTPTASSARCSAAVPEATASTCSAWTYSAKRRSSSAARGPVVSQPERRVSATASISSSPIAGGWNPSIVGRFSDETFCTDLEAYETSGLAGPVQGFLAAVADREHSAGSVGSPAEIAEDMARLSVDADVLDAFDRPRLVRAFDLLEDAFGWDQEANDAASNLWSRLERRRPDRFAERRLEREAVQVDAERELRQFRVVAAAESRRDLDHLRTVGPDPKLRVARAVLDPERADRRLGHLGRLPACLARPDVCQRNAERGRLGGQAVGDGQRMELAAQRERVHGHLGPLDQLLDDRDAASGLLDRP